MYKITKKELSKSDYSFFFNYLYKNFFSDNVTEKMTDYLHAYCSKKNIDLSKNFEIRDMVLDQDFFTCDESKNIIELVISNLGLIPKNELLIEHENNLVFSSIIYSEIWEDKNLPNFYVLHDGLNQNYLLFDKIYGRLLPFFFHDICPCSESNMIIGRHHGELYKFDFCKLIYNSKIFENELSSLNVNDIINNAIIDEDMDGIESISSVHSNELDVMIHNSIVPITTNVPYFQIPLNTHDFYYHNFSKMHEYIYSRNNSINESDFPF
jgi:hypothetical protein